jgi:NADH pyrophosphatase NudC (nudix superfamily)
MSAFNFCPACAAPLIDRVLNLEARRACSANCGYVHYDNPTPVVAVVVEYQGLVVLAHNRGWTRPFYGLITGFLERQEAPEQCALREVKEELNLDATSANLIGAYPFEQMNQVIIGYHVVATGAISLNDELDDYRLVPPKDCYVWPTGTGFTLRDWLRTKGIEPRMIELPRVAGSGGLTASSN